MYATNCTVTDLERAAGLRWKLVNVEVTDKHIRFSLRHYDASNAKYFQGMAGYPELGTTDDIRRKSNNLCLHAHYEYFARLFTIAPDAVIKANDRSHGRVTHTAKTLYDNYTKMRNQVMRTYDNLLRDDCCNCPTEVKP